MTVRPEFVPRDPQAITADMVAQWERLAGKTLYPAQVERLLIDLAAYRETLTRQSIQESAEQNLLGFARGTALDALGELLGAARLPAEAAGTIMGFTLVAARAADTVVPAGTLIKSGDSTAFATLNDARIAAGEVFAEAPVRAVVPGPAANGYDLHEIRFIDGFIDTDIAAANQGISYGGRDPEGDEPYRERLRLAASRPSCGTFEAYRLHALSVSSRIVDAGIDIPEAGRVRIYLLTDDGAPDVALLAAATLYLNARTRKPLTDWVEVLPPVEVGAPLDIGLIIDRRAATADTIADTVSRRLDTFAAARRRKLGASLRPEQISGEVMSVTGVIGLADLPGAWHIALPVSHWLNLRPEVSIAEVRG